MLIEICEIIPEDKVIKRTKKVFFSVSDIVVMRQHEAAVGVISNPPVLMDSNM